MSKSTSLTRSPAKATGSEHSATSLQLDALIGSDRSLLKGLVKQSLQEVLE